jgi:hypothetical protein
MFKVYCPDFFQFAGNNQKTALRVHIIYDEEQAKLVFRSNRALEDEPIIMNCSSRLIEVYCAMVAVAVKRLRWMRNYPSGMKAPTAERAGVIDGRQVAHIVNFDTGMVDQMALDREQVRSACRFLNPQENVYWERIMQHVSVTRCEDFIELEDNEQASLLEEARKALENLTPDISGENLTYRIDLNNLSFAPNLAWKAWAIQNAHRGDSRFYRTAFECDYVGAKMRITWKDETRAIKELPRLRSNYFSNMRKSSHKLLSD